METIILDTETTGLSYSDEIIEIGICDLKGNVLFDERIKPSKNNTRWPDAERIHGISPDDVKDCRTFPEIYRELASILNEKNIVIFNAGYDTKLLRQSCANWLL
ncbi:3'-5' exonuclease, partial [Gluconobacter thailandicus]